MIKNYFKTAWRNLVSNKFYSAINIIGLTVGLTVGLLILLWVNDELIFDSFHTKAPRIYHIAAQIGTGDSKQVWGGVSSLTVRLPSTAAVFRAFLFPKTTHVILIFSNHEGI